MVGVQGVAGSIREGGIFPTFRVSADMPANWLQREILQGVDHRRRASRRQQRHHRSEMSDGLYGVVGGCSGLHQEASEPANWLQTVILQGVGRATRQFDKLTIGGGSSPEPQATQKGRADQFDQARRRDWIGEASAPPTSAVQKSTGFQIMHPETTGLLDIFLTAATTKGSF